MLTAEKQRAYEEFKSHNWYKLWKKNFSVGKSWRQSIQSYLQETEICEWINCSMRWDKTREGFYYWDVIHSIWWSKYNDYGV